MTDVVAATKPAPTPNWRSTKFWYSVALQVLSTTLLRNSMLTGDQWVNITVMIYGGYVLGNVLGGVGTAVFNKKDT